MFSDNSDGRLQPETGINLCRRGGRPSWCRTGTARAPRRCRARSRGGGCTCRSTGPASRTGTCRAQTEAARREPRAQVGTRRNAQTRTIHRENKQINERNHGKQPLIPAVSGNAKILIWCLFRNSYARRRGDNLMQWQKKLPSCANGTKRRLFRGWTSPSVTQGAPINLGEPFTQQLWSKEPRSEGTRRCASASASFHRASGRRESPLDCSSATTVSTADASTPPEAASTALRLWFWPPHPKPPPLSAVRTSARPAFP